ncbi:MAG: DNA-binding transcriptional LysR family regulator [Myxococcota bacterium]|jgi:DNA-binding transcriptional LysR family regulator
MNEIDVEVRHLRALAAVVDQGTFTDAAIELGVSQATVSRTIGALEAACGARLLHRTSRVVALTQTGERLLPHARAVLRQMTSLSLALVEEGPELRIGFAWGALGRHTLSVQRRWADRTGGQLVFVQSMDRTAGLAVGAAPVAVLRWRVTDDRFETALVGVEQRFAALPLDDPMASQADLTVADLAGRTVAIDRDTGSTTSELWPVDAPAASERSVRGVEAWLTLIAAGQAVGITASATVERHSHTDVAYVPLVDAPPTPVWLVWVRNDPPPGVDDLVGIVREAYAAE